MSLGFSSPLLLIALAGVAIPLLVHLLRQRRPRPTIFPPLALLLLANRQSARRRRLRDLLLLLARMALLAAVAMTLAGPHCNQSVPVPEEASRQQAAVILVDDTLSMRFRRDGRTLFARAKERVKGLLQVLPDASPVALLTVTGQGSQVSELSLDRARLRQAAAKLEPTWRAGDATDGLDRAQRLLAEAPEDKPRAIYLLTDLTRTGFSGAGKLDPAIALRVIDVAGGPLPNVGVIEVRREPAGADRRMRRYRVTVRNSTPHAVKGRRVRLRAGGRTLAEGRLDIGAHARANLSVEVEAKALPSRARFATVRVDGDALADDDVRTLSLGRPSRLQVLLVDGDPRETRHDDELFFVEAGLRALGEGSLRLSIQVIAAGDLPAASLKTHDVVVLCNVRHLERRVVKSITRFVEAGGGLLLTLGDQVDAGYYNQVLGPSLLPGRLRSFRSGGVSGPSGVPGRISGAGALGPLGEALSEPATRAALLTSRVRRHALVVPHSSQVLLRMVGGAPLLLERRVGRGRVLLWATTVDRDWTDLPIRPAFLPLVRTLLLRLSGQGEGASGRQVIAGHAVTLRPAAGDRGLVVQDPEGQLHRLGAGRSDAPVVFADTERPGGYRVFSVGPVGDLTEQTASAFAVVPPPAESDLRRLARAPHRPGRLGGASAERRTATIRRSLATPFAVLCLLLLFAEALLAARFGQWWRRRSGAHPEP